MAKCNPAGRDCLDRFSGHTFNCSMTCEGIYSDVQWLDDMQEDMKDKLVEQEIEIGGEVDGELTKMKRLYNDLRKEMERLKDSIGHRKDEVDSKKYTAIISEYKKFKKNNVKHFRLGTSSNLPMFSKLKQL